MGDGGGGAKVENRSVGGQGRGLEGGEPGERKKEQVAGNQRAIEMLNAKCKQTFVTLVMRNMWEIYI